MTVERDGLAVEIGGPRQRSVLAVLVLARGRVVPLDRLIDLVYEGDPPPSAVGSMQAYVSALRRMLEPDRPPRAPGQVLVSSAPGYAVRLPEEEVDAWRFETLVAQARRAMTEGQWERARHLLREGLSLWRGDLLSDLPTSLLRPERTRLEEARVVAESDAARVERARGRVEAAAARLTGLAASTPLREPLWELYALALYRAGRQAEALAVCGGGGGTPREGPRPDPGSAIANLETAMLRQDPSLDGRVPVQSGGGSDLAEAPDDSEPGTEPFVGRDRAMSVLAGRAKNP